MSTPAFNHFSSKFSGRFLKELSNLFLSFLTPNEAFSSNILKVHMNINDN